MGPIIVDLDLTASTIWEETYISSKRFSKAFIISEY